MPRDPGWPRRWSQRLSDLGRAKPPSADAASVASALSELGQPGQVTRHQRLLRELLALPEGSPGWRALGDAADHLVDALAQQWVGPDFGQLPAVQDADLMLFGSYTALLLRLGQAALPSVRLLLAGPPLPVNAFGYEGAHLSAFGAKLSALPLIGRHGGPGDVRLLARLVRADDETDWVRIEAARVWRQWQPAEAAAAAASRCLVQAPRHGAFVRPMARRLAGFGAELVPPLLTSLAGAAPDRLERAAVTLELVGPEVVPLLLAVCRESDDVALWSMAEQVLARLDRRAHAVARGYHADMSRGLSPAVNSADPERGLSAGVEPRV